MWGIALELTFEAWSRVLANTQTLGFTLHSGGTRVALMPRGTQAVEGPHIVLLFILDLLLCQERGSHGHVPTLLSEFVHRQTAPGLARLRVGVCPPWPAVSYCCRVATMCLVLRGTRQ